ncbi:hypothetical protein R3P38DRAFT_2953938 [Favolaschia claudopus]|uniref:Secreted protein n=1 Tax=Favolaschia claudopus TaxID=2862362 RepID=A0AAW0BD84_9AGAR
MPTGLKTLLSFCVVVSSFHPWVVTTKQPTNICLIHACSTGRYCVSPLRPRSHSNVWRAHLQRLGSVTGGSNHSVDGI